MAKHTDPLESKIHTVISHAANEIALAVRRGIAEEVSRAIGASIGGARKPGRPPKAAAAVAAPAARAPSAKAAKPAKGKPGRKPRKGSPDAATLEKVLKAIKDHPGLRSEQLRKQLPFSQPVVKASLAKLREAKSVKTKGDRRATTYTAA